MQSVAGIFQSRAAAEKVAKDLLAIHVPPESIIFLSSHLPATEVATCAYD